MFWEGCSDSNNINSSLQLRLDPESLALGVCQAAKQLNFPAKWEALPVSAGCSWERAVASIKSLAQGNPWGFQAGLDYMGIHLALHVSRLSEQIWEQIDGLN